MVHGTVPGMIPGPMPDPPVDAARWAAATDELASAVDNAISVGAGHDVDGVVPRLVVAPATAAQVSRVLTIASAYDLAVVVRGHGTKLSWGMPPRRLDVLLDLAALDGLVEHSVGEFVAIAGAGMPVAALQDALAAQGQCLAVDPIRAGTVGGLVATGLSGPLRMSHGALRDLVIGAHFMRADGVAARTGGKVAKNVAGYDLGKLLTGSFGTLAVLTQVAFRLHPMPAARRWITAPLGDPVTAAASVQRVIHSQCYPAALEIDRDPNGGGEISVLLQGVEAGVEDGARQVTGLLDETGAGAARVASEAPAWWGVDVRADGRDCLVKITHEIAELAEVLDAVDHASERDRLRWRARGSAGTGVLWATAAEATPEALAHAIGVMRVRAHRFGGSVVVLDGPAELKTLLDPWGPVAGLAIMRRIKESLDPRGILAPGRFVGGI